LAQATLAQEARSRKAMAGAAAVLTSGHGVR